MNKKKIIKMIIKIILIIIFVLLLVGYCAYKYFSGPSVNIKEKKEIKNYVENYLTKKYGEHKYKVTHIEYEYDMETLFDYSNPTGYWVDFKSDIVSDSWVIIKGLYPEDYEVDSDYLIQSYYFYDKEGYDTYQIMKDMEPKKEIETILLKEIQTEFEPKLYDIKCNTIILNIPKDYGKVPTLEELKTNTDLYKVTSFDYNVSSPIENPDEYKEKLKKYISNKYNRDSNIYIHLENTKVSIDFI